jgi:putative methylase
MRRKELEIALQRVRSFDSPDPSLEQYMTPATMASEIVFEAYRNGDIEGMKVIDLGCGTGMFSIAASLMGAGMVRGFDRSPEALAVAEENARELGVDVEFVRCDVSEVSEGADTVLMNPPFGCQTRGADRPFLEKALSISECVYSIHMAETLDFVRGFAEARGRSVSSYKIYKYEIPHTFAFHTRTKKTVDVAVVNIR